MSIITQMFQPGGGVVLIPFIRMVIAFLMVVCLVTFISGVARIHMAILTLLSGGLLLSLSFFQSEYDKFHGGREEREKAEQDANADDDVKKAPRRSTEKTD